MVPVTNGQKYLWAARIAMFAMASLAVTTLVSIFKWPADNGEVLRSSNALFASVVSGVLGFFFGASRPDPDAAKNLVTSITGKTDGDEGTVTVATSATNERGG